MLFSHMRTEESALFVTLRQRHPKHAKTHIFYCTGIYSITRNKLYTLYSTVYYITCDVCPLGRIARGLTLTRFVWAFYQCLSVITGGLHPKIICVNRNCILMLYIFDSITFKCQCKGWGLKVHNTHKSPTWDESIAQAHSRLSQRFAYHAQR